MEERREGGGPGAPSGRLCRNAACTAFPWLGAAEGFRGKRRRGSMNISLGKQCGVLQRTSGWSPWRPLPCAGSRNCEIWRKTRERGRRGERPVARGAILTPPPGPATGSTGQAWGFVLLSPAALGGLHEAAGLRRCRPAAGGAFPDPSPKGCFGDLAAARSVPRKQGVAFNPNIQCRNGQSRSSSLELQWMGWLRGGQERTSLARDA